MIVVPIARDRCFFYRKFLFTLDSVSLVAIALRGPGCFVWSLYSGGPTAHPLEELLNPVN
jgi:hypothetical protein